MWRFAFILALLLGCTFSRHLESTKRTTDEKDSSADIEEYGAVEKQFDSRDIYRIGGPVIGAVVVLSLMSWIISKCLGKKYGAEGAKGKGADTNGKEDTKLRPQNKSKMYTTSEVRPSVKQSRGKLESASVIGEEKSKRKSKSSSIIHTGKVKPEKKPRSASIQHGGGKPRGESRSACIQQERGKSRSESRSSSIQHQFREKSRNEERSASIQQERGKSRGEQRSASMQQQERGTSRRESRSASIHHQERGQSTFIHHQERGQSPYIHRQERGQSPSKVRSPSIHHQERRQSPNKVRSSSIHHQDRGQCPSTVRSSSIDRQVRDQYLSKTRTPSIDQPKREQPPSKLTYTPVHHSGREDSQGKLRTTSVLEPRREQAARTSFSNKHWGRKQPSSKHDMKKENEVRENIGTPMGTNCAPLVIYEQADFKKIQNDLKETQSKMADLCNQFSSLRQELKASHKVFSQESGENVHNEGLLNASSGWRGRSQQKISLQEQQDLRELSAFPPGPLQQPSVAIQPYGEPTVGPSQTQLPPVQQPTMEQSSYAHPPPTLPVGQTIVGQSTLALHPPPPVGQPTVWQPTYVLHPPPPAGQPTIWQSTYALPQPPPVGQPGVCQSTPSIHPPPPVGQPTVWQSTHSLPSPPPVGRPTAWQSSHAPPQPTPPVCQSTVRQSPQPLRTALEQRPSKRLTMVDLLNSPVFKKSFEKHQRELSAKKSVSAKTFSSDQTSWS